MGTRFKKKSQLIDIGITAVAAVLSVGIMIYGLVACFVSEEGAEMGEA